MDALVIRGNVSGVYLREQIAIADRIYMMGHGTPDGLLGHGPKLLIDRSFVELLRVKQNLVGIWCHADGFFERYGLNGLYTGMIVSEPLEAKVFNIKCSDFQIHESNHAFANGVRRALEVFDPEYAAEQAREFYSEVPKSHWTTANPVIEYNVNNIFDSRLKSMPQGESNCPVCGSGDKRYRGRVPDPSPSALRRDMVSCSNQWHEEVAACTN
jgi:hypothetical protein